MSLPALVVIVPLRLASSRAVPTLEVYRQEPPILLNTEDFLFFAAVGVLWYWIGAKRDRYFCGDRRSKRSKAVSAGLATTGLLFAVGLGVLATKYIMLTEKETAASLRRIR